MRVKGYKHGDIIKWVSFDFMYTDYGMVLTTVSKIPKKYKRDYLRLKDFSYREEFNPLICLWGNNLEISWVSGEHVTLATKAEILLYWGTT